MNGRSAFFHDRRGTAAAEMVLLMPLLVLLLFGSTELGYYFYMEHQVVRGTREAARYAARKVVLEDDSCPDATTVESSALDLLYAAAPSISDWSGTSVTVNCDSGFTTGLYDESAGHDASAGESGPVVTVTAAGTYPSLFSFLGFVDATWTIGAEQHAAVIGL